MSDVFDRLPKHRVEACEVRTAYLITEIREVFPRIEELDRNSILVIADTDGYVEYGFFEFFMGPSVGPGDLRDDRVFYLCAWRGYGFGGKDHGLREMRHTYFSPDEPVESRGYVFYLQIDATIKALQILKEYFD